MTRPLQIDARERAAAPSRPLTDLDALVLCVGLFLAPNLIFSLHFPPLPAAAVGAGVAVAGYVVATTRSAALAAPFDGRLFACCLALAATLCLLGGEFHVFFSASDWILRDAVLADAIRGLFPLLYRAEGADYFLRAPLGMYMLPALAGRALGLNAAHFALLAQNSVLYAFILYFTAGLTGASKARFLLLVIFFSGVDIVPRVGVDLWESVGSGAFELNPLTMFWNRFFKYFGHIPSLFWAPNHALPAWCFAAVALMAWRRDVDPAFLLVAYVMLLFWSPLAMIGALPFLALCGLRALAERSLSRRELLAAVAAAAFAPIIVYLTADSGAVPHEWLIGKSGFWGHYAALMAFAVPQVWLVAAGWRLIEPRLKAPLALAAAFVVLAPFYKLGDDNDMAMRCTLAPLFVLSVGFAELTPALLAGGAAISRVAAAVIALSSMTGLFEIRRAVADPAYRPSDCNILTAYDKFAHGLFPANYLARLSAAPAWMTKDEGARLVVERRVCWPDYRLIPPASR